MDEDEHKEIDRTHNLNSARTFFYQGEAECDANMKVFINCIDAVKGRKSFFFSLISIKFGKILKCTNAKDLLGVPGLQLSRSPR